MLTNKTILIVDDYPKMRKIIKKLLNMSGFNNIREASDAEQALFSLQYESIDIILTDWNMPGMTGLELIQEIRNDSQFRDIPILLTSVDGKKTRPIQAYRAGADGFIMKPFNSTTLYKRIKNAYSKSIGRKYNMSLSM